MLWRASNVPADGAEAEAWTVRGWADLAAAFLVLGVGFAELDEIVGSAGIAHGGPAAARLRAARSRAGPVPGWYPRAGPRAKPCPMTALTKACVTLIENYCRAVRPAPARPYEPGAAESLAWGARHRPSPVSRPLLIGSAGYGGLVGRAWLHLPDGRPALIDASRTVGGAQARVWRGVHEGAHLDHMAAATDEVGFGASLLVAEAYAMAVEITAMASCALAGEREETRWLRAGLIERTRRVRYAGAFAALPRLAGAYVVGPLALLAGVPPVPALPGGLRPALLERWADLRTRHTPSARLAAGIALLRFPPPTTR